MKSVRALILAAGRGKRLGDLTSDRPKCMIEINGKTLMDRVYNSINNAGINRIAVVTGYMGAKIHVPEAVIYRNHIWDSSNMVRSMLCADEWIKESDSCIISYSDIIYSSSAISTLLNIEGDIALISNTNWETLWRKRFENPLEDAETFLTDREGFLMDIGGKPINISEIEGQYMGLFKLTKNGWETITDFVHDMSDQEINKLDITSLFHLMIKAGIKIRSAPFDGYWYEVDNLEDYNLCRLEISAIEN